MSWSARCCIDSSSGCVVIGCASSCPRHLPLLHVDGRLIEQVLENLLDNASKYTPARQSRSASARRRCARQVEVSVEDDGPGLPAADPEILFEKFQRGAPEGAVGGIGLGLAICRTILRAAQGPHLGGEPRAARGGVSLHAADRRERIGR